MCIQLTPHLTRILHDFIDIHQQQKNTILGNEMDMRDFQLPIYRLRIGLAVIYAAAANNNQRLFSLLDNCSRFLRLRHPWESIRR